MRKMLGSQIAFNLGVTVFMAAMLASSCTASSPAQSANQSTKLFRAWKVEGWGNFWITQHTKTGDCYLNDITNGMTFVMLVSPETCAFAAAEENGALR